MQVSGYLHLDHGGDSGTAEYALMALDYYSWTGDAQYLRLPFQVANYFMHHFPNRTEDGRMVIWPAQVRRLRRCEYL